MAVRSGILVSKRFRLAAVVVVLVAVLVVAIILYDFSSGWGSGPSSTTSPSPGSTSGDLSPSPSISPTSTVSSSPISGSAVGQLNDATGDVLVSQGSSYPGIVDLIGGSLNVTGNSVKVSVIVDGAVSSASVGESVQWNVLMVLENQTTSLKTYAVSLELNSTGFFGMWTDVASGVAVPCNANYVGNSLFVQANVDLGGLTKIEWNVNSIYQNFAGVVLNAYASDNAPDAGLAELNLSS